MVKDPRTAQHFEKFIAGRKEQDIEAQIEEAEQIVHSLETIDSLKAFNRVKERLRDNQYKIRFLSIFSRIAAILFLPLLITSTWLLYRQGDQAAIEQFSMQKITNPPGVRSELILPDGSKVWLNAESTIRYQIPFDLKSRSVELTGEAFFEVKKDEQRPFHVESGKLRATVLGTCFNYKAFPEDTVTEIVLAEGKVRLNSISFKTGKEIILESGERAVVHKKTNQTEVSVEKTEKYIGWHEGKLIFDECPLSEVARRLDRWFGIDVKIADPGILNYQISTTFENESLQQILALLELASPIKTDLIPATIEKTTQRRNNAKVIITSKN